MKKTQYGTVESQKEKWDRFCSFYKLMSEVQKDIIDCNVDGETYKLYGKHPDRNPKDVLNEDFENLKGWLLDSSISKNFTNLEEIVMFMKYLCDFCNVDTNNME